MIKEEMTRGADLKASSSGDHPGKRIQVQDRFFVLGMDKNENE